MRRIPFLPKFLAIWALTFLAFGAMGYHPGAEDDGVYLAAVKADLHPSLYPHDSDFFRLQLQATVFDRWMAVFDHISRIPLAWAELLGQLVSLFVILWACHSIAECLFDEVCAQWAGTAMVGAMFTLPVAGTALYIADQYFHPRNLATALILLAVARVLALRRWEAGLLLLLAVVIHPIMGALGVSFSVFVVLFSNPARGRSLTRPGTAGIALAMLPMGWIFEPPSAPWRQALETRDYYFLSRWAWYEWLGAVAPLALFWLLWLIAARRGRERLWRFALAVLAYGLFQQAVALALLLPPGMVRLLPFQPMRYLQLVYVFLCLVAGALLGGRLLGRRVWRWVVFGLMAYGGMFLAQRAVFRGTAHLELPGQQAGNPWLQAFDWVRSHTPENAYFALDPDYMKAPGEDFHSFRALAERSVLSDGFKDAAVVTQVPSLAWRWRREQEATAGWSNFQLGDFERLKGRFGVDWVVVSDPAAAGLVCLWHNGRLAVCRIP